MTLPSSGLQLRSSLYTDGELRIFLTDEPIGNPGADEVLIRVEAAPINPSDLSAIKGEADISLIRSDGSGGKPQLSIPMAPADMAMMAPRLDEAPAPAGNEGAGIVIAAGSSPEAQALIGRVVAVSSGAMYAQYKVANIRELLVLKEGTTPVEAASSFVNPLTALSMVETMRREGHTALVHTAAASNLGQMLNRLCIADGVPLVNIVRSSAQADILRDIGAEYVLNSSSPTFLDELKSALEATNATLCFDAISGGELASQILASMEAVQAAKLSSFQRYGSAVHKQVYCYGVLNISPTLLSRTYGMAWGVSGWLLPHFLERAGPEVAVRLMERVASEIKTTFASHYTRTISLREFLDPEIFTAFHRRATGEKYLVAPHS